MSESHVQQSKDSISKRLINTNYDLTKRNEGEFVFSNKQTMFEQYKLLVDSSHKIEERRSGSNSIFLGINTLLASFLIRASQLFEMQIKDATMLIFLSLIGMFICWDWLKVTASYKQLNYINYSLIRAFEKLLPTYVFSLRAEVEVEQSEQKSTGRANVILIKENTLPKVFILFYLIYLITIITVIFKQI